MVASKRSGQRRSIRSQPDPQTVTRERNRRAIRILERDPAGVVEAAFRDVGSLEYLTPVRDVLGEEYSFDELRLVRIAILARGSAEVVDT